MSSSLSKLFSRFLSLNPHQRAHIEDDWELIEFLDRELSSDDDDDVSIHGDYDSDHGDMELLQHANNIKIKYRSLSVSDLRKRLEEKITKVCTVLLLSRNEAAIILQHFKWSVSRTNDEWLACEEKVRKAVGLFVKPVVKTPADAANIFCSICHAKFSRELMFSVSCGHQICCSCWKGYISEAIDGGPRCLTLRCREPSCDAAVGPYLIELLSSKDDKKVYENHLLRSYVANRRKARWCPALHCNYAVFSYDGGEDNVTCRCSHSFCWNCLGEAHAPVNCATLVDWMSEGNVQTENWMIANTYICQNCKVLVYIDSSCTYARCTNCNYEFCSACGDNWSEHKSESFWLDSSCRNAPLEDNSRINTRNHVKKYQSHYEEWTNCALSREIALADLKLYQEQLDFMCAAFGLLPNELEFLIEALLQVIQCWQVLKWTYVYGYHLPDHEQAKKNLFEFLQEEATRLVRGLHKELQDLFFQDISFTRFMDCKSKITKLTRVTKNYFVQLVKGLVAGLPEVDCFLKGGPDTSLASSPPSTVMKGEGHINISSPVGTEADDMCVDYISLGLSPTSEVMKGVRDINICSPVDSTMFDDSWVESSTILEPELQPKSKIKNDCL